MFRALFNILFLLSLQKVALASLDKTYDLELRRAYTSYMRLEKEAGRNPTVVFGCGRKHKPLTSADLPHDHPHAFTVSLFKKDQFISNPHYIANVRDLKVLRAFPDNSVYILKCEHMTTPILGEDSIRPYFLEEVRRMLAPGGKLIYLSGGRAEFDANLDVIRSAVQTSGLCQKRVTWVKQCMKKTVADALKGKTKLEQKKIFFKSLEKEQWEWREMENIVLNPGERDFYKNMKYLKIVASKSNPGKKRKRILNRGESLPIFKRMRAEGDERPLYFNLKRSESFYY